MKILGKYDSWQECFDSSDLEKEREYLEEGMYPICRALSDMGLAIQESVSILPIMKYV